MEWRWPLGLGLLLLLLLLCTPLPPGARAKEGTDPRPDPPSPARLAPCSGSRRSRGLSSPPLLRSCVTAARASTGQANLWSLTPNSCFRGQSRPPLLGSSLRLGVGCEEQRPDPHPSNGRASCPGSPSLGCPTPKPEPSGVRGGKSLYVSLSQATERRAAGRRVGTWGARGQATHGQGCPPSPALLPQLPRLGAEPCTPLHSPNHRQSRPSASGGSLPPRNHL